VRDAGGGDFRLKKRLVSKLRIYRAYSQVHDASAGLCRVSRAWAHAKFVKAGAKDRVFGSRAHDYAVLTTSDGCSFPKSAVLRLWATQPGEGELRVGQAVRAAGYPADPRVSRMSGLNMWRTEGKVRPVQNDARHLVFTGYVSMGMSGGPVWKTFNSGTSPCGRRHCVVGLVTECEVNGNGLCKKGLSERLAVRITPQVKQLIRKR
jgi:V8-like Glu-specific endopeptidase